MSNLLEALMKRLLGERDRMAELAMMVKASLTYWYGEPYVYDTRCAMVENYPDQLVVHGSGHFALVVSFVDEPDVVYKLGLKKEDSGAAYAAWCRANPGPHVPEILDLRRYSSCYIVKMPRYYAANKTTAERRLIALADLILMERGECKFYDDDGKWLKLCEQHAIDELDDALKDTLRAITKFFTGVAAFDLHSENAMWSSLGTDRRLIITDPVSFKQTYKEY